jgi:hypothetical protein
MSGTPPPIGRRAAARAGAGRRPARERPIYVYAIADAAPPSLPARGMANERLETLKIGTFHLIVGEIEALPPLTLARLRRQQAVVGRVAASVAALLPVRYGTLLSGRRELRDVLRARATDLRRALTLVRGRCQMTLRLVGPKAAAGDWTAAEPRAETGSGAGAAHLARLVHRHRTARQVPELAPLRPELDRMVHATRVARNAGRPEMATIYHLIDRRDRPAYRRLLRTRPLPSHLTISGPWPPYAFVPELG